MEDLKESLKKEASGFKKALVMKVTDNIRKDIADKRFKQDKFKGGIRKAIGRVKNKIDKKDTDQGNDIEHIELDDFDDVTLDMVKKLESKGCRIIYPNLKYRKPKYHHCNEVLKYVESAKDQGDGVKLVIMNFND